MKLSVIFVNYHSTEEINSLVADLKICNGCSFIVVDNSLDFKTEADGIKVIRPIRNLGFGSAINAACLNISADWIILVNPDITIKHEEWLKFVEELSRIDSSVSVVHPSFEKQKTRVLIGGELTYPILSNNLDQKSNYTSIPGFSLVALRFNAYTIIGGFDPNIFMYAEDLDYCIRIYRKYGFSGFKSIKCTYDHLGGGSYKGYFGKIRRAVHSFNSHYYVINKNFPENSFFHIICISLMLALPRYFNWFRFCLGAKLGS